MSDLVTLAEAKLHLRVTHDDEDTAIAMMIAAASEAVADIVGEIDPDDIPVRVKLAVLTRVAVMFDTRDSIEAGKGELPMLTPLRKLEV
ncbi:putative phage protein (predicted DNA packaging) [Sphingobium wenxiniae]|uniref:Putative phage protein (Predicted DNA packaging) n=1 Tax=Sphingobium wenxiniae (strain DSM 21828 / CGMCC 1.7748 / JZ-1) TaxID=595605 RepID=A0A562KIT0_SPHWJ|nr:head-tail connector protein [Sphingobium wenxiniae]MBB6192901.1 putative phage protein (predicted DNA packaging) [Sphingobium wenxiniae]TWH95290.1 putative phage protein (predicted DNA packaging) [Sphingobium wenxiniae]